MNSQRPKLIHFCWGLVVAVAIVALVATAWQQGCITRNGGEKDSTTDPNPANPAEIQFVANVESVELGHTFLHDEDGFAAMDLIVLRIDKPREFAGERLEVQDWKRGGTFSFRQGQRLVFRMNRDEWTGISMNATRLAKVRGRVAIIANASRLKDIRECPK